MAMIHVRTDDKKKHQAQVILKQLGLDLSTAINVYLVKIIERKGIPFELVTENGMTPAQERKILREEAWAMKHGKRYTSTKEMFKDILRS